MASQIDPILDELTREAESTRRILERVPTEKMSWRPHEKSKSVGDLAWHIASLPGRISAMAQQPGSADPTKFPSGPAPADARAIADAFTKNVEDARAALGKLSDADLAAHFEMAIGEKKLFSRTKLHFLRTVMLNHMYHHRGQLSVYLRLLGVPVPPIYGPTADEA